MVYGIVKQTGGFIYLDSLRKGEGDDIQHFPAAPHCGSRSSLIEGTANLQTEAAASASAAAIHQDDASGAGPFRHRPPCLLVEDEDSVRMGGIRALQSRGYTVHEAASGVEALEVMAALERQGGHCRVSDVVMPEMDGPTLAARTARQVRGHSSFIFVSGYAEDAFAKNLPADAKFGFLPKPFSLKQLGCGGQGNA